MTTTRSIVLAPCCVVLLEPAADVVTRLQLRGLAHPRTDCLRIVGQQSARLGQNDDKKYQSCDSSSGGAFIEGYHFASD